jgi:hypothetical protein
MVWKGIWSSATAYAVNDAVQRSGQSYICRTANTGSDPAVPGGTFNAGNTTQGSTSGGYSGITAVKITLTQGGTLNSISIFLATAGVNIILGLYNDASGLPGSLLAASAVTTSVVGTNTLPITSGPTLAAGTYWLVIQNQTSVNGYYNSSGAGAYNNSVSWTGSLPATWPTSGGGSGVFDFSLYATFTGSSTYWDLVAAEGAQGINSFTTTTAGFTVPPVGSTTTVTVTDASWIVVGQMVYIDTAGGGAGHAGALQVTAKTGNTLTLLNPQPPPAIPPASSSTAGLLNQLSGNVGDYVGGDNASHSLATQVPLIVPVRSYGANGLAPGISQRLQLHDDFSVYNISNQTASGPLPQGPIYWGATIVSAGSIVSIFSGAGQDTFNRAFGSLALLTGAATGGKSIINTGPYIVAGLGALDLYIRFCFGRLPTAVDNFSFQCGIVDASPATGGANGIVLANSYQTGPAAPAWQGQCYQASTVTTGAITAVPTSVAIVATAFSMFNIHIAINAAWTSVSFFVNGTQIGAPISTNIPAVGLLMFPWLYTAKTAGSSAQGTIYLDDFFLDYQYATP